VLIPDSSERKVRLPVRIVKGHVRFLYGRGHRMPTLRDGAIGDLMLDADDVLDENWREFLLRERREEILPQGTLVLLGMRPQKLPSEWKRDIVSHQNDFPPGVANHGLRQSDVENPVVSAPPGDQGGRPGRWRLPNTGTGASRNYGDCRRIKLELYPTATKSMYPLGRNNAEMSGETIHNECPFPCRAGPVQNPAPSQY